jgi:alpha-tubulin suppressor-like RCC1 family protein
MACLSCSRSLPVVRRTPRGLVRPLRLRCALILIPTLVGTLGCRDDADSPNAPETPPALAASTTQTLSFYQLSAGNEHTCGVTTDNRAYCWGFGLLGDGSAYSQRAVPVAVAGTLRFRQVSAGTSHFCGVTTDYRAYCWGENSSGQLGDGTTTDRLTPVLVAGGHLFRVVEAGFFNTCGVSYPERQPYCWGANFYGQLGEGTTTDRWRPTLVAGGRQFRQVSPGWGHTCGVTTSDAAFCWGSNRYGQVGDGSTVNQRLRPTRVLSGRLFRQLDAGGYYTCAVAIDSRAFCWGDGRFGQIGDGKTYLRFTPRAVAGGLHFDRVTAGYSHACGETPENRVYCWGNNPYGGIGDGSTLTRLTPVPVAGGLTFSQVSAGSFFTCGKTPAAVGYCWGYNVHGELGNGTSGYDNSANPLPGEIAGPM